MVIGIAGKSCSGKNQIGKILSEEFDFLEIDADIIGHKALRFKADAIAKKFSIPVTNGEIDRKELSNIVFNDSKKLLELETILFPEIEEAVKLIIATTQNCSLNGVKILESALYLQCDYLIWVSSPYIIRFIRAIKRDKISIKKIYSRFNAQRKLSAQPWKKTVDIYKVRNNGTFLRLKKRVLRIIDEIKRSDQK